MTLKAYLSEQLITYLGNKRKLIDFIGDTIDAVIESDPELSSKPAEEVSVFDIFSGSGVVSRAIKARGHLVLSNDYEKYSVPINKAFISYNKSELESVFTPVCAFLALDVGGDHPYDVVIDYINDELISPLKEGNKYFSLYYAPQDTHNHNFDTERLFYTQENALKIDAILEFLEFKFRTHEAAKDILLASLLYCMTTNINTSGTMKGFHNGWGGKNGDALSRITDEIKLKPLPLIDGVKGIVFNGRAETVFKDNHLKQVDIIYADPPYNQHQYSANYHMLNTAVLNDRYPVGNIVKGTRAGIRKDHYKSEFCYKNRAYDAFVEFVGSVDCKYLVVSYSNEGILSTDEIITILSADLNNTISIEKQSHTKYKGGKSTKTSNHVVEYLFIVKVGEKQSQQNLDALKREIELITRETLVVGSFIDASKILNEDFTKEGNTLLYKGALVAKVSKGLRVDSLVLSGLETEEDKLTVINALTGVVVTDKAEIVDLYLAYDLVDEALKSLSNLNIKKHLYDLSTLSLGIADLCVDKNEAKLQDLLKIIVNRLPFSKVEGFEAQEFINGLVMTEINGIKTLYKNEQDALSALKGME